MAPALTKVLKNGHGIHLSSPPASVGTHSNRSAMRIIEPQRHATLMEDGDLQTIWLNFSPFHPVDSCPPSSLLDASVDAVFSPRRKASASQSETDSQPTSSSFVERFSCDKGQRDFQASCSAVPGVPGMFLAPAPEHKSQEACVRHEQSAAPECRPDGGDVHYSSLTFNGVCPSYSHEGINSQGCGALFATPATLTQGNQVTGAGCPPSAPLQSCIGCVNPDQLASRAGLQDALKERLSRQAGLHDRAGKLQRRLQGLLGEQAVRHCSRQLEGLKRSSGHGKVFLDRPAPAGPDALPPQAGTTPRFSWDQPSEHQPGFFTQVSEFSRRSQLVLSGLQAALDSEATASSSSDEEPEENHGRTPSIIGRSCEMQWLEERAELASKWSLLQLHLDKLEGRIQHLIGVHKDIRSNKPRVLLADSQPLTDRQIQQTLMKEITGLSCTGSDTEVCSPTRLLHNIERQTAHLNQIVNSLMPPLSFSPLSKPPTSWNDKRTFTSAQRGGVLFPVSSKRRPTSRRLFKGDASCVCARTRPLVSYHKPKLFTLYPHNSGRTLNSTSSLSSCLMTSSCSCCSCDPVDLCSDLDCSTSSTTRSKETSMLDCSQRLGGTEAPLLFNVRSSCLTKHTRYRSPPLRHSQKYKHHARQHRKALLGLSPVRVSGSGRTQPSRTSRRMRKRKHISRVLPEEEDVQHQLDDAEENSDDMLKSSYTCVSQKQASQGFVRRHQRENAYNINSVVMPMSLTKVEKLQYKDILTPRWRLVETHPPLEMDAVIKANSEEMQVEDLSDEVFAQRHMALEQKEKLRWSSWEKRKCSTRPGSRLSGGVGGTYTSGEESSLECSAQLDADEQSKSEEQLPHTPWELRAFPLDEDEEALQHVNARDPHWTTAESSEDLSTSNNSDLHPDQSSGATLPSRGRYRNSTPNGSFPCRSPHI